MRALGSILALIWRAERRALSYGIALSAVVLMAGAALLGLSGWFITATGIAGLLGIGIDFDVFRPSAGVRMLALGRTAARYGERLTTHDAVLRALAVLRGVLLARLLARPFTALARLRGSEALNRLTSDVDALDGVALRLAIPLLAGAITLAASLAVLGWLVAWPVAAWATGMVAAGSAGAFAWLARAARRPSRRQERAAQALRMRSIDLMRAQPDLVVTGRLHAQRDAVLMAEARLSRAKAEADRAERRAGAAVAVAVTLAAGGALAIGSLLAAAGTIGPAQVALGFFATLALAETTVPLRRGFAELGRMIDAARRVAPLAAEPPAAPAPALAPAPVAGAPVLALEALTFRPEGAEAPIVAGLDLTVGAGEAVALTGASGAGKSTVLALVAGLMPPTAGAVRLFGQPLALWPEAELRAAVTLLPQRSVLMRGSIREALDLARPGLDDAEARAALAAVALDAAIDRIGGLAASLGDAGSGLSGGEARRLALARVILRRPRLLLLDEPTEGLDAETARRVLSGVRDFLPEAAILIASHRAAERAFCDRLCRIG